MNKCMYIKIVNYILKKVTYMKNTYIILTITRWDEPPRIRHQISRMLSKDNLVLFVETPIWREEKHDTEIEEVEKNIIRCRLGNKCYLPFKVELFTRLGHLINHNLIIKEVNKIVEKYSIGSKVLLNFNFYLDSVMKMKSFDLNLYFSNDDIPNMANNEMLRKKMNQIEKNTAIKSDLCLGVSYPIVNKLKQYNKDTYLLLPGHSYKIDKKKVIEKFNQNGIKINVAFMGYIDSRVNSEWLEYLANANLFNLYLIGPMENEELSKLIKENKNVFYLGVKYGDEILNSLLEMDILIMPYLLTKGVIATTAANKLYQYLSAGKPIVISNMPHFINLGEGIIYKASTKEEFCDKIVQAYKEDRIELVEKRLRIAGENTWDDRIKKFTEIIDMGLTNKNRII